MNAEIASDPDVSSDVPKPVPTPGRAVTTAAPAASFGEVSDDGTVFLRLPDGSMREVGQWAAGDPTAALEFFTRKYQDLVTEIDLAAKRLADDRSSPEQAEAVVERVRKLILEPAFVGDLGSLVARIGQLEVLINVKRQALADAKAQKKEEALASRQKLADEAKSLADSQAWRVTSERFKEIIEEWKTLPRVDRGKENALWKELSASRTTFDKARRAHYAALEANRNEAKDAKLKLVEEAKALSTSRDWNKTTIAYRHLLDRWKKAGRAGKEDDALWAQFRAAQDGFFEARKSVYDERNEEETQALAVKEALLTEAEKLLPIKDLRATKKSLRTIQAKWDKAGRVPRNDVKRIEARLKKVEDAVRDADSKRWKQANPELQGRANETVSRFADSVTKLEKELVKAKESGNEKAVEKATASLESAKALLAAAEKTSKELS